MDHITELRGRVATLQARRVELGQRSAGYAARTDLTAEDRSSWDEVRSQITEIDADVGRLNQAIEQEEEGLRHAPPVPNPIPNPANPPANDNRRIVNGMELRDLRMRGEDFDERGQRAFGNTLVYSDPEVRRWFNELRSPAVGNGIRSFESRDFQAGSDAEGGFLSAGEQFVANLIQAVDNQVFIRQVATVQRVQSGFKNLGAPSLETDAEDTDWTTEISTGNEEDSLRLGKRLLEPHPLAKLVKISRELLRASQLPAENIVTGRVAYKNGVTQEKAFLTGSGAGQPLGVFTASPLGISTGRDVSTGNTSTSMTFDGIIEAQYSLKAAYWARARWMLHRDGVKQISKLKDGDGQYLWQPSVRAGDPDMLRGFPIMVSEYAPNTFTTGQYVGMFADWSNYWIADSLDLTLQRLVELYARSNQIGFISRLQCDGMPVLEEAFVRIKLG